MNKPRPFQFSLLTLLAVPLIVAAPLGLAVSCARQAHRERLALQGGEAEIRRLGGEFDEGIVSGIYYVGLPSCDVDDEDLARLASLFRHFPGPELDLSHKFSISLSGNPISDAGLEHLRGLDVITLDVRDTQITDASVDLLASFPESEIFVGGTRISPAGLARIRKRMRYEFLVRDGPPLPPPQSTRDTPR